MNSKTFFRRMTVVLTVKTQRKRISSNLKNLSPTKPIQHELVCEQNMFCYLDFRSYLEDNYPKSLLFALKITFAFEIHCKKYLPTLKTSVSCQYQGKNVNFVSDKVLCMIVGFEFYVEEVHTYPFCLKEGQLILTFSTHRQIPLTRDLYASRRVKFVGSSMYRKPFL